MGPHGWSLQTLALVTYFACVFRPLSAQLVGQLHIAGTDVDSQLKELSRFSDDPAPAVTRILFTENDMLARNFVKKLMSEAGLTIREDPMGNVWGRWAGSDAEAGAVVTGSHCDAIPHAGMYDGTLGVVGAIAAVKGLRQAKFKPKRPIDVLFFTSEEPTRFGFGCIGSRGMAGTLTAHLLDEKLDENGTSFKDAATAVGYGGKSHQDILERTRVGPGQVAAFVELHIEQGPLLEREGVQIGVVTAIAAPASFRVQFNGDGGHAGALLMPDRHDPVLAAAEVALHLESVVKATGTSDTVGTTGAWHVLSNNINSVPREARIEIDIRDIDLARRDSVVKAVLDNVKAVAQERGVTYSVDMINQDPPATAGDQIVAAVLSAVTQLGLSHKQMVSRAYHDSLFMAQIAPAGMIFIPCKNGWSHRPEEFSSAADIENGVKTLALTLAEVAGSAVDDRTEL